MLEGEFDVERPPVGDELFQGAGVWGRGGCPPAHKAAATAAAQKSINHQSAAAAAAAAAAEQQFRKQKSFYVCYFRKTLAREHENLLFSEPLFPPKKRLSFRVPKKKSWMGTPTVYAQEGGRTTTILLPPKQDDLNTFVFVFQWSLTL